MESFAKPILCLYPLEMRNAFIHSGETSPDHSNETHLPVSSVLNTVFLPYLWGIRTTNISLYKGLCSGRCRFGRFTSSVWFEIGVAADFSCSWTGFEVASKLYFHRGRLSLRHLVRNPNLSFGYPSHTKTDLIDSDLQSNNLVSRSILQTWGENMNI